MRPLHWLLLAISFGATGLFGATFVVTFFLPLAENKGLIFYYPAEERIKVYFAGGECDRGYQSSYTIPLDPPMAPRRIKATILEVCERRGFEGEWAKTDTREPREILDHIETLALRHDRMILGSAGLVTGIPVIFCLVAAAFAGRKRT